jgi:hypothetical protein
MKQAELEAGFQAVRRMIDSSGYGRWVSDAHCRQVAFSVLEAAEQVRQDSEEPLSPDEVRRLRSELERQAAGQPLPAPRQ